ncbi:hypothetical protein [Vibrio alginolyticus]|uniref:hypothetical protein n=1 Tax=Vibrio alginolyticus TaxID=663 RepID=UPI00124C8B0D|nr:hypothetical protein [Vibrio alginolyticus]KAB2116674.1 hypothetical protein F6475_00025 [Vibrio alginolyticus]
MLIEAWVKKVTETESIPITYAVGEDWPELGSLVCESGDGGIENLALIPVFAGLGPFQKWWAYGLELKDICDE